jgi:hypothetical protein
VKSGDRGGQAIGNLSYYCQRHMRQRAELTSQQNPSSYRLHYIFIFVLCFSWSRKYDSSEMRPSLEWPPLLSRLDVLEKVFYSISEYRKSLSSYTLQITISRAYVISQMFSFFFWAHRCSLGTSKVKWSQFPLPYSLITSRHGPQTEKSSIFA